MTEADRAREWKIEFWTEQRDYAQRQLEFLRKSKFESVTKDGRKNVPDQIERHKRDLAEDNERLEDLRSN